MWLGKGGQVGGMGRGGGKKERGTKGKRTSSSAPLYNPILIHQNANRGGGSQASAIPVLPSFQNSRSSSSITEHSSTPHLVQPHKKNLYRRYPRSQPQGRCLDHKEGRKEEKNIERRMGRRGESTFSSLVSRQQARFDRILDCIRRSRDMSLS